MSKNFLFNPRTYEGVGHEQKTQDIMKQTIARFEHKSLREMKQDDREYRYCDYFVKEQRDQVVSFSG